MVLTFALFRHGELKTWETDQSGVDVDIRIRLFDADQEKRQIDTKQTVDRMLLTPSKRAEEEIQTLLNITNT